jgi:beta-glucanase (GH16 family)
VSTTFVTRALRAFVTLAGPVSTLLAFGVARAQGVSAKNNATHNAAHHSAHNASHRTVPITAPRTHWQLRWHDEFTGAEGTPPDARWWTVQVGDGCSRGICGWGNQEREWYSDSTANAALTGTGLLAITARAAPSGLTCWYGPCRYTSARLVTAGHVSAQHARVEARMRLPKGQGLWPAFWLLGTADPQVPWPDCGELDVMEFRGSIPHETSSAIHGPGYSGNTPFAHRQQRDRTDYSSAFHRFAVEWSADSIVFSVDGRAHYTVPRSSIEAKGRWVFDAPFSILLNLAIGGHFDGDPASERIVPATMLVDYVRVYERATQPAQTSARPHTSR